MALLAWNVRGLGNKDTVRALKNDAFNNRADIIFLSEMKQKKRRYLEKIRMKMKFDNTFYIEPEGIAGGLALWWSNEVKLYVLHYDKNFIDTKISISGEPEWYGDFNVVACPEEKYGGAPFDQNDAKWYYEFLNHTFLMEIPSKGGTFTWSNKRCDEEMILEKLDRVVSSMEWNFLFPKAISIIDIAIASDHSPIILLTNGVVKKAKKDFKFESRWLLEEECSQVIKEEWENRENGPSRGTFRVKLKRTRVKLRKWNKVKFGANKLSATDLQQKIMQL
ncbi:hypothetical protein V6N11_039046 [Hibiscus sabdariffa]|uniref:Endonuclease/exonuclease/phosphatase domain-containing protein n=1 Tax=Hibiscus sabdariffa TaxID=183260 RepID=A0ABR2SLT4_9ROSI